MPTNQIYNLGKEEHLSCTGLIAAVYMLFLSLFRLYTTPLTPTIFVILVTQ